MRQTSTKILAINRGEEFSPNHISNDAAILRTVAENLSLVGFEVNIISEAEYNNCSFVDDIILNMGRDNRTISKLKERESTGALIINSAYGVENCRRRQMTELLINNEIPHPTSYIIDTNDSFTLNKFPYWIKRGDSHAIVKDDVCFVKGQKQAESVLEDFRKRGIRTAIVNEHVYGDLIKFYGVNGTDFFKWFYPSPSSNSKFGLEQINGSSHNFPFDTNLLNKYASLASLAFNVPVYGGDCVVSEKGEIKIIDFNDWPSFARFRKEAGEKITEYVCGLIKSDKNKKKDD